MRACHGVSVEIGRQLTGASSFLPPVMAQGLNSGQQV